MKQNGNYMRLSYMEHYCRHRKKRVEYYFDSECTKRDYLYEYQVTRWMPFAIRIIQGRIGKKFVVKHYRGRRLKSGKYRKQRIIMTKVPDMSRIVATAPQRQCRNLFKEAVAFARTVITDEALKQTWKQRYRIPSGCVYYKAMKVYMLYLQRGIPIETELLPCQWQKPLQDVTNNDTVTPLLERDYLHQFPEERRVHVLHMPVKRALRLTG